jgi:hypothetical protein
VTRGRGRYRELALNQTCLYSHVCMTMSKSAPSPDLKDLEYDSRHFRDISESALGKQLWPYLKLHDNLLRMETATALRRAAVEPLAQGLIRTFGPEISQDRLKQTIGHMVRQIMEALGYELDRQGLRISQPNLFTSGTRYKKRNG